MSKVLLFLSFLTLGMLVVLSAYSPDSSAIWLASTLQSYNVLRVGIMLLLLILLVTNPPRHLWLRALAGVTAGALGTWSLMATYQNEMQLLDGASLLIASIALAVTTMEPGTKPVRTPEFPRKPTIHRPAAAH